MSKTFEDWADDYAPAYVPECREAWNACAAEKQVENEKAYNKLMDLLQEKNKRIEELIQACNIRTDEVHRLAKMVAEKDAQIAELRQRCRELNDLTDALRSRDVMRLALEALVYCEALNSDVERQKVEAIAALRKELGE